MSDKQSLCVLESYPYTLKTNLTNTKAEAGMWRDHSALPPGYRVMVL